MFTDGITTFRPDKTLTREVEPRVREANFGDGYSQRIAVGSVVKGEKLSAAFKMRPKAFIQELEDFLDLGSEFFTFTAPDGDSFRVRCISYSTIYNYGDYWSTTVELERVYNV